MATYTIYGDTADGDLYTSSPAYASARTTYPGSSLLSGNSATFAAVGQELNAGTYYIYQACIGFDTSSVSGTVSSATLDLFIHNDQSATDFTIEARTADWASAVTVADYIVGGDIAALPLRASLATSGITTGQYNSFTSDSSFPGSIGSSVKLMLFSDRNRTANAPSGAEYIGFRTGDMTPQATYAPRLTITTLTPAATPRRRRPSGLYVR